jgi:hypothetical protein
MLKSCFPPGVDDARECVHKRRATARVECVYWKHGVVTVRGAQLWFELAVDVLLNTSQVHQCHARRVCVWRQVEM